MLGIVTVDRQLDGYPSAIWVTNQSAPTEASHSNAVVLDVDEDPSALAKIRSLTRGNIVVKTAGSDIRDLSIEGGGRVLADIQEMVQETRLFQREIRQLVADYRKRTRTSLVDPDFPTPPDPREFHATSDVPHMRALALANYVVAAWTCWLKIDEERRRRTVQPRTGNSPWIMPEDLNSQEPAVLPRNFAQRVVVQKET